MNVCIEIIVTLSFIFIHLSYAAPIEAPNRINILIGNDNYEINKFLFVNGVNYLLRRFNGNSKNSVQYSVNSRTQKIIFKFEKPEYEINTIPNCTGIVGQFSVLTNATGCIEYGLGSDDVYINNVFQVGPDSGILYATTTINVGTYEFNITADITNKELHAVAKVVVNVKANEKPNLSFDVTNLKLKHRADADSYLQSNKEENPEEDGGGDVNTNQILKPPRRKFWKNILRGGFNSDLQYAGVKELLDTNQASSKKIQNFLHFFFSENSRYKRAVAISEVSTTPYVVDVPSIATVQSKRIYQESPYADAIMSGIVVFVVSSGTLIFFGSIFYFAYKRLKNCGDYELDEDVKSTQKPCDDETVNSTVPGDLKNPYILDIKQHRVVDSIEITKQKLFNGPPSVFTIQRSYEEESENVKNEDDGEMFIIDMSQLSVGSTAEFSKIILKSNSASTPTITATLVDGDETVPQSILSTSRRNSISSRKDGSLTSSIGDISDGQNRRKSVTFSDIVELYRVK